MLTYLGLWSYENGLAVFTAINGESQRYTEDALRIAIGNVRRSRASYHTEQAYSAHISHLETGLGVIPVSRLNESRQ